jgi:hypothetical protein
MERICSARLFQTIMGMLKDRPECKMYVSNIVVEAILRHGRKHRAHCWLGSQRVAHLNVSALHSYFVNILPSIYDRMRVTDAFAVSYDLLDKTLDLETGQWGDLERGSCQSVL